MKKLKKIDYNVFFFAAGGLTDCIHTLQPGVVFGPRLARSCLLLLLLLFFFFFFQKCCRRRYRRRRRRTPSPPVKYLPTYLTCRVADFTTLGTYLT